MGTQDPTRRSLLSTVGVVAAATVVGAVAQNASAQPSSTPPTTVPAAPLVGDRFIRFKPSKTAPKATVPLVMLERAAITRSFVSIPATGQAGDKYFVLFFESTRSTLLIRVVCENPESLLEQVMSGTVNDLRMVGLDIRDVFVTDYIEWATTIPSQPGGNEGIL